MSPAAGLNDGYGKLGLPLHLPHLMKGALRTAPSATHLAPLDAEQLQPMQEMAAAEVILVAQIQIELLRQGFWLQAQAALLLLQILLQRHSGHIRRDAAQFLAHDQPRAYELQRRILAHADDRSNGLIDFIQSGGGSFAHGGQRIAETCGFNDVRGGAVDVLLTHQPRDFGDPCDGALRSFSGLVFPEKLIPAR